jgi:flavin-binding protein dodecin
MGVVKVIELVGKSGKGWDDAAKNAVEEASKTINGIIGIDVIKMTAKVDDGKIIEYKATVKLAFKVRPEDL